MAEQVHCDTHIRSCGATTKVIGQSTVYLNGKLVSVEGDICSHGGGALKASNNTGNWYINGKKVVFNNSSAYPDDIGHINPKASSGSSDCWAG